MTDKAPLDGEVRRKVVICGDYRTFIAWCRDRDIPPSSVYLVDRRERLLGLELREEDIVRLVPVHGITESDILARIR